MRIVPIGMREGVNLSRKCVAVSSNLLWSDGASSSPDNEQTCLVRSRAGISARLRRRRNAEIIQLRTWSKRSDEEAIPRRSTAGVPLVSVQ